MTGKEQLIAVTAGLHFVEIDGTGIEQPRTYTDKQTQMQKPLPGRQTAFLWQGDAYPMKCSVEWEGAVGPYRPGLYVMCGDIFEPGKFGRLEFKGSRNLALVPLSDALDAYSGLLENEKGSAKPNLKAAS